MPEPLEFYSTVPISGSIVVPEAEDIQMNGFAWSTEFGLMLSLGNTGLPTVEGLRGLRETEHDNNTNNQGLQGDF